MNGPLHLAWRYVVHYRTRTTLLALALGLTMALPLMVKSFVNLAQVELRARAEATPLVLGTKGSAVELTLNALYFRRRGVEAIQVRQSQAVQATGLADAIPLYVRFHSQESPIVGTTLEYFAFRRLKMAEGRMMGRLGDCVVGAKLAKERALHVGDSILSSPEQVFDLAGVYPLKMRVTGILAESHGVDDHAIFVDVKTTWLMEGIAHGHDDVVTTTDATAIQEKRPDNVVASKAVRMFSEVTDANIGSFHFHGDTTAYPLTAVLVLPHDAKTQAILLGRYQDKPDGLQLIEPTHEMDALMSTLLQAEQLAIVLLSTLGMAVLLIAALVFALSFKMRRREFGTLEDIGVARSTIFMVKAFEVVMVTVLASTVVLATTTVVAKWGVSLVRLGLQ